METTNTNRLVKKAIKGDSKAFEEIVQMNLETIMYGSLSIMKQYQDAEDATQDIIIKMHKNIKHLKNPAAFNIWLHRIINNHCFGLLGKKKRMYENTGMDENILQIEEKDREFLPQDFVESEEKRLKVREAIEALPEKKRFIVTLFYYDEMSYKEISEVMDMPLNTVASELKRARQLIRTDLEKTQPINANDINKFAAVPVLSQIMTEHAREAMPQTAINNLMEFTKSKVIASSVAKNTAVPIWKIACTAVLLTGIITSGIVYACDGLRVNIDNGAATTTSTAINQTESSEPTGELVFENGDCNCGHANPGKIFLSIDDDSYTNITWKLINKKTKQEYTGTGNTITTELSNLYKAKKDGEYTAEFIIDYPHTQAKADRDFIIDSGEITPGYYQ